MLEKLTKRVSNYILENHTPDKVCADNKIKGVSEEISLLKELKDELVKKDKEIEEGKIQWDRTFDAIIDHIVIIGKDGTIEKVNKSFQDHADRIDAPWKSFVGVKWEEYKAFVGSPLDECIVSKCFETSEHQEATISVGDTAKYILVNPIFGSEGEVVSVVRVSRDISSIQRQKRMLEKRTKIFEAVAHMSQTLVDIEEWDNAVKTILSELGITMGAYRVYMFENELKTDRLCAKLVQVWRDSNINCLSDNLIECVNYDEFPEWKQMMEDGELIKGEVVKCRTCDNRETCTYAADASLCAVPIFSDKRWWGFIGFDYPGRNHWRKEDETLLRIAADIIGGVITHRLKYQECIDKCDK